MDASELMLREHDPVTRFVTAADGSRIAYRLRGVGPPLVLCNGLTTSDFFWRRILPRWSERFTVVTWDYKGHGDSGPAEDLARATIEDSVDDPYEHAYSAVANEGGCVMVAPPPPWE